MYRGFLSVSEVGMYYRGKVEGFSSPRSFQTYEHLIHLYKGAATAAKQLFDRTIKRLK